MELCDSNSVYLQVTPDRRNGPKIFAVVWHGSSSASKHDLVGSAAIAQNGLDLLFDFLGANVNMEQPGTELTKVPLAIFDQDPDGTLDVSEEMEEIRELFYDLIKNKFPSGVTVEHLEKVYKENYEQNKTGPVLPSDWLDHIRVADEFEVVNRGPIIMVYTRQRNAPSIRIGSEHSLKISKNLMFSENRVLRIRLTDKELAQQMKTVSDLEPLKCPSVQNVVIVHCVNTSNVVVVHLASKQNILSELQGLLQNYYEEKALGELVPEPEVGGVYAIKNEDSLWCRGLLQNVKEDSANCLLVDFGKKLVVKKSDLRRMRADFVLPRKYPICAIDTHVGNDEDYQLCIKSMQGDSNIVQLRFVAFNGVNRMYSVQWIGLPSNKGSTVATNNQVPPTPSISNAQKLSAPEEKVVLSPMDLSEMPKSKFSVHILAVLDAENISFRQCSLDPIPDYISSAVQRDSLGQSSPPSDEDLIGGNFFTVYLNSRWERVLLLGKSSIDENCFRVYAVDLGIFSVAKKHLFRYILLPKGLRKIMMAKCQIHGIKPADGSDVWSRDCQKVLSDVLFDAKNVEVDPIKGWSTYTDATLPSVPFASAVIYADGVNIAEMLVKRGLAALV
ncbi:unnamed protein product [Enterobius vermicularis]|uniref:Tudor domain-containing protein n=1 Tax=Enterobius vermicularis TaxID=51028 RepID=A0A0N4UVL3_ENTVE|nr:unnamed protein product [Enterobius vermicularis]